MNRDIKLLFSYLVKCNYVQEAFLLRNTMRKIGEKILDETDIDNIDDLFEYLEKHGGQYIYLDNPIGTRKSFGGFKPKLPFHYGEFSELINPADDMGWDVIIVPSMSDEGTRSFDYGNEFTPVGVVFVNPDENEWRSRTIREDRPSGKPPPIGNDKIILAGRDWNKEDNESDVGTINSFFRKLWQFKDVTWLK
jgi:hypothetical protein